MLIELVRKLGGLAGKLSDGIAEHLHVLRLSRGENTVAEIENVAIPLAKIMMGKSAGRASMMRLIHFSDIPS